MLKKILKIAVLLFVFAGGVVLFSGLMNHETTESASDLADPTLPVMCIDESGNKIDRLYGYLTAMDPSGLRDALIPMTTDRTISVSYKAYGAKIKSVTYEVTAPDTGEVIENAKIGNFREDGEYMTASFSLTEPILMNREYPIRFTIETDTHDIQYYARLIQRADLLTDKYVQFVYDFYETCTNKAGASSLNTYLETDNTITNSSYTDVNLKSTLDQVTWGTLNPQIIRKAVPTIKEINAQTCSITDDYLITAAGDSGETEIYHVHEFYRLRYYNGKMMVLNFNRKAMECFDAQNRQVLTTDGISLGVASKDVVYVTNAASDIAAFIQDNALWEFNAGAQKVTRVFSFHNDAESGDERDDHNDYGIRIVRVSESGDIDFLVYGYMDRGAYEGRQGVLVCHYSSEGSYVEESAFVPFAKSNETLEKDIEKLSYVTTKGICFLYLEGTVCRIDLDTHAVSTVLENIYPDCFVSSADGSKIAWMDGMKKYEAVSLTVMDLETEKTYAVAAEDGTYVKAVGFINDDFIYGIANKDEIQVQPAGDVVFAMKTLEIISADGTPIKTYSPDGYWVSGVTIKSGLIELTRVKKAEGGGYTAATTDNIMNNKQTAASKVTVTAATTKRQGTIITLKMPSTVKNLKPLVMISPIRAPKKDAEVSVPSSGETDYELYYTYAFGSLYGIYTDPEQAVTAADTNVGVVLNREGQYIYERGNTATENEINNEDIPEAIKSGELDTGKLQESLGDSATVMNLTGCTLAQVLYEVSEDRAVLTRMADGSTALIVGYNHYNTRLYNFKTGEHYWMGINDSTNAFKAGGNVFVSYTEPDTTVKGSTSKTSSEGK